MGVRLSRRGWNNVIIIAVVVFIAVIQFPELLRNRQMQESATDPAVTSLLPATAVVTRLVLPAHELSQAKAGEWQSHPPVAGAQQLITHWQTLSGTRVDEAVMAQLKPQLSAPRTAEIWLASVQEPVRVTYYQLPQFWLLRNWQGHWLAVTVDEAYLFPVKPQ
ncbi:hypothetical protein [Photobacterium atrarenae]|uniref:Uncharacterized protein n=1 Tax=Photobacterium atrarenae TaxID=865757 RepID=A0ABY5GF59_9GAMM|nr:hypothetical protein [Photobacterium atrarenae]UTV27893.1 hypothetical protein NNL38_00780 [Photobacterium atrarenae]